MNKRPLAITLISWLFIGVGCLALTYHLWPGHLDQGGPGQAPGANLFWVCLVRALAIVAGAFMLRGANWARWLLALWLVYHVGLSILHSLSQTLVHALLAAVIIFFLFRPRSSAYFRARPITVVPQAQDTSIPH